MIETNMQQQQQESISKRLSQPDAGGEAVVETGLTVTCALCDAVYAPSPQQAPFLQDTQEALETAFLGTCHFCFRCRRAACPQCWDEVHGVCGSCVQEAGLPFRAGATLLDGLMFPPAPRPSAMPRQQQDGSLFVPVRNGRFYNEPQARSEGLLSNITTGPTPAVQPVVAQTGMTGNHATDSEQIDTPAAVAAAMPTKTPLLAVSQETPQQEETPQVAKQVKKASRLEVALTWIVLVLVLVLVAVIALAEFLPAVNTLVAHATHIDIHAEIAYLVHSEQQHFKRYQRIDEPCGA
jgi:uncharacterized membrane protein (DUF485 family)